MRIISGQKQTDTQTCRVGKLLIGTIPVSQEVVGSKLVPPLGRLDSGKDARDTGGAGSGTNGTKIGKSGAGSRSCTPLRER